jgi:hypothetical protein
VVDVVEGDAAAAADVDRLEVGSAGAIVDVVEGIVPVLSQGLGGATIPDA